LRVALSSGYSFVAVDYLFVSVLLEFTKNN
jgi:hypothetical protein